MGQFSKTPPVRREKGVVKTAEPARTAQGGAGFKRDSRSELFMTAVTTLVGKDTFYESNDARTSRFVALVQNVAGYDPEWLQGFIPWLRDEAGIRTASVVAAVEYAYAGGPEARTVVRETFKRADEPAEALAYARSRYGRRLPKGLKKGLADSCIRLYNPMTVLKYDSKRNTTRPSDVIALTRPKPKDDEQNAVFTALHDRRHNNKHRAETMAALPLVLDDALGNSATWERASGQGGKTDWNEMIPKMGAMALLRNLRNFDADGITEKSYFEVVRRLSDPEQIRKARLFPLRFLSAWDAVESVRWGGALEAGLNASLQNVPSLDGNTLILWDCSGSMGGGRHHYGDTPNALWKQAGVFAMALARRSEEASVVAYSNNGYNVPVSKGGSILRDVEKVRGANGLWGGTQTWAVCNQVLREKPSFTRVVVVTDEQTSGYRRMDFDTILGQRPCYILNVAGYEMGSAPSDRVVAFAGFNDRAFIGISQAEAGITGSWPWLDV